MSDWQDDIDIVRGALDGAYKLQEGRQALTRLEQTLHEYDAAYSEQGRDDE